MLQVDEVNASRTAAEGQRRLDYADKIGEVMNGQPILIGHHSEGRHRRDIEKMHNNISKGYEQKEKSKYYEHRAELAKNPRGISSDDPDAIEKLKAAIEGIEEEIAAWEKVPKKPRDYSFSKEDCRGFEISNRRANIRRIKERIEQIESVRAMLMIPVEAGPAA